MNDLPHVNDVLDVENNVMTREDATLRRNVLCHSRIYPTVYEDADHCIGDHI